MEEPENPPLFDHGLIARLIEVGCVQTETLPTIGAALQYVITEAGKTVSRNYPTVAAYVRYFGWRCWTAARRAEHTCGQYRALLSWHRNNPPRGTLVSNSPSVESQS
jgi:hypothetical protein